ncbi:MAG: CBS domain-containing protein [Saprospiraceae bacterium]|nr:CBS domain-containing protein [Saprospiraceae bacterium]MBK6784265.1 CBS domain-containing protein [Saprospiraceae bacterium]MBK8372307.1 CBS domain-containing protein [Saprospiraceae bacterium]MBK8819990.1 CBS domain-containing protein [Saprospiraceae bacterium]MBK8852921.1 CBS domain-containing protein [Saprospiraceae bacterium]
MGEQRVSLVNDNKQMQKFVKALLNDVSALEYMLENEWFESDVIRIGAEQEIVMVDKKTFKPSLVAMEALEKMTEYPWVETELGKFNLETNLEPRVFTGNCFSELDKENTYKLDKIQEVLDTLDTSILLTGICPTLRKYHLNMENLTPKKRYYALMEAINKQLIGQSYELRILGIDELLVKHDSPLLEACNTSFQVHLQVAPKDFVKMYNISLGLAAPIMAISANSPIVFGKRLWHETRIALFQQSLDTRTTHDHMRERSPRVSFGKDWIHDSILEIYREDIARFRVLLSSDIEEDSMAAIKNNQVPKLRALQVHNSTVYRWNRPCYGISDNGKPHLRIENRVLPSGPTVIDEVANACFWLGCMIGLSEEVEDIKTKMSFVDARDNFGKAAKFGLDTKFTWFNDEKINAVELVMRLLPIARKGLEKQKVDTADIDKYLNIIEKRAQNHMTGARWMLRAFTKLHDNTNTDEALSVLTASMIQNQMTNTPVHEWVLPDKEDLKIYRPSHLKVSEFMLTDLFTVQKDDIVELVADLMDWNTIRYTPVEDSKGNLVGLVTARLILRHYIKSKNSKKTTVVSDIMIEKPVTIDQDANIMEAMKLMRENKIGCLPVVNGTELVGLISETEFLRITASLLQRM